MVYFTGWLLAGSDAASAGTGNAASRIIAIIDGMAAVTTSRAIEFLTVASFGLTGHSATARVHGQKLPLGFLDCSPVSDVEARTLKRGR
jgi:hypothetical protein